MQSEVGAASVQSDRWCSVRARAYPSHSRVSCSCSVRLAGGGVYDVNGLVRVLWAVSIRSIGHTTSRIYG